MFARELKASAVFPASRLQGRVQVPGDKSISHRALILGAMAEGTTRILGFLPSMDCLATLGILKRLGVRVQRLGDTSVQVDGVGMDPAALREPESSLNVGNSGTTIRLMMGFLAGRDLFAVLTGDASIRRRPMHRVVLPLRRMGAMILGRDQGNRPPIALQGGLLSPIDFESPVSSAQVKSALLLAGLYARGETIVREPSPSRDHTERMLEVMGCPVRRTGNTVGVTGPARLSASLLQVPGDLSSAAYFLVAAAAVPGSSLLIPGVGVNPTRSGIMEVLRRMGARIALRDERIVSGEPVADLQVSASSLSATEVGGDLIPRLIDEIPVLAVAAARARGTTVIRDAAELRVKESDRIETIAAEFGALGVKVTTMPDGLAIEGPQRFQGGACASHGDHRVAMALAVAGLTAEEGPVIISDTGCVDTSFPGFFEVLDSLCKGRSVSASN